MPGIVPKFITIHLLLHGNKTIYTAIMEGSLGRGWLPQM